ncbi:PREDICTED: UPF0481 protein At3g47200-like [Theobroma cacao]|uniref:UPF0481 protein At3g47200-like n=1 Tax=Theobroma cacao TaxID=3641 RepID=A0AB32X0J9_THECC|nr:PREDICTED: UPF0481 protein At3g47200-like [Theobroma cacao]
MAANTGQEIAPLNENNDQPKDPAIDVPGPECCIFKIPRRFRAGNEEAYTPHLISIGPIHHGDKNLTQMELQKQRCYKKFLETTSQERLTEFHGYVKSHLIRICRCYEVQFICNLEVSQLIEIISNDAVFIIALFLRDWAEKQKSTDKDCNDDEEDVYHVLNQRDDKEDDYYNFLNNSALLRVNLLTDLTLLENQIPFFVLEDLYKLAFFISDKTSFLDLACLYFGIKKDPSFEEKKIKHFTDLIRYQVLRAYPLTYDMRVGNHNMHNATKLHEAGVKFKCTEVSHDFGVMFNGVSYDCFLIHGPEFEGFQSVDTVKDDVLESTTYSLLQVHFEKGLLKLLTIDVEYETEIRFRNLMAFEQYYYPKKTYFCSYIKLLDSLIDTKEDVDLLIKEQIIVNKLGSSAAVATMINKLAVGVVQSTLLYGEIGLKLNRHYKSSWNRRCASLKHVYFNTLWRGTATVAAFIVVVLTLTQTVLAILDRAKPTK